MYKKTVWTEAEDVDLQTGQTHAQAIQRHLDITAHFLRLLHNFISALKQTRCDLINFVIALLINFCLNF